MSQTHLPVCQVLDPGRLTYAQGRELQERIAGEIIAGTRPPTLIVLQHPHTFTFGRRGQVEHLLWTPAELDHRGVKLEWIDRGGDVTYHGPGQLVGYPILPLGSLDADGRLPQADYTGYLRKLERVLIAALMRLGIASAQIDGLTGVWIQPDVASRCRHCPPHARQAPSKIASIGVKVDSHGITRHGFALNVNPDMEYWNGIIACGLSDHAALSLAQVLDPCPPLEEVREAVIRAFGQEFGFHMQTDHPAP
jgi:lipoate-protein ligase B